MDLTTAYLGFRLKNPLIASASPLTLDLDNIRRLEDHGAAAVVLPSIFEEQIEAEAIEIERLTSTPSESFAEALSYFPPAIGNWSEPRHYLDIFAAASRYRAYDDARSWSGTLARSARYRVPRPHPGQDETRRRARSNRFRSCQLHQYTFHLRFASISGS